MTRRMAAAALIVLCASSALAQTADEVVEKNLAALGGRDALRRIRTRVSTGAITLTTAVGPVSGTVQAFAKAPNKSRTLITLDLSALGGGQIVNDQRFDGTNGVILDSLNGNRDITGDELASLRNSAFPTVWLDYRARGLTIALTGKETLGGRPTYVLETTPKSGPRVRAWVDAETYMVLRTAATVDVPPLGQIEQATEFSDYRTVDGVKIPFSVRSVNPMQTITAVLSDVKQNVDVDDALFAKP